jgi:hypothetical protein
MVICAHKQPPESRKAMFRALRQPQGWQAVCIQGLLAVLLQCKGVHSTTNGQLTSSTNVGDYVASGIGLAVSNTHHTTSLNIAHTVSNWNISSSASVTASESGGLDSSMLLVSDATLAVLPLDSLSTFLKPAVTQSVTQVNQSETSGATSISTERVPPGIANNGSCYAQWLSYWVSDLLHHLCKLTY